MIGRTISHYRIIQKLGQGGLGEGFLAHGASLDRKVALKFLPDIFSGDPERLARFERVDKALAKLAGFDPNYITDTFAISPDGTRIVLSLLDLQSNIMIAEGVPRLIPACRKKQAAAGSLLYNFAWCPNYSRVILTVSKIVVN